MRGNIWRRMRREGLLVIVAVMGVALALNALQHDDPTHAAPNAQKTAVFGPVITAPAASPAPPVPATPTPPAATPSATPAPAETAAPAPTEAASPATATPTPFVIKTPLPTLRADMMGVQLHPDITEAEYDTLLWLVGRLGVKWLKLQFDWSQLEPEQGVLSQTGLSYGLFAQRANQQGLHVIASVAKAPGWARATQEEDGPPRDPADLGRFINMMQNVVGVDLYGNSYFEAIEVWNEPNLRREWNGGTLSGTDYMRLFDATYQAVRAGVGGQSIILITAGLAPTGINDGVNAIDDRVYLRQMYNAGLADPKYQSIAIGVHPYGAANPPDARCCGTRGYDDHPSWFFLNTLEDYHAIMQEYGDSRKLWATEFGWGTYDGLLTPDGNPAPPPADPVYFQWITEEDQGNYIIRAFEIGQSLPYMGPMILWNLNFAGQEYVDQQNPQSAYALLRSTVNPLRIAFLMLEAAPKQ